MPRPTRIEYENAFYHVMNRGRARNNIFFKESHYLTFIKTLEESCERFNCVIHSYCLMPNHYHLLIQTMDPNLGRVMRHINGVYTQRFNKIQKIDGPLFKGRYKAILVDSDDYLFELSKYIHRNPIQTKNTQQRLVERLEDYQWSSYQSYLGISKTPNWLNKELTLSSFKPDSDYIKKYQLFVEREDNKELQEFFNKKNLRSILGTNDFKEKVVNQMLSRDSTKQDLVKKELRKEITTDEIIDSVVKVFNVSKEEILEKQQGRPKRNVPRSISMYLMQNVKNMSLKQIAKIFGLNNHGSASYSISIIKEKIDKGFFDDKIDEVKNILYFKQEA